jgi:hypothetical protein
LKILHQGARYIEQGIEVLLIHRTRYLAKQLRKFGYDLRVTAMNPVRAKSAFAKDFRGSQQLRSEPHRGSRSVLVI